MPIPFGKWQPDIFDLDSGAAGDASGVLPGPNSKRPWPSLTAYSEALGDDARGFALARKSNGEAAIYVGTATGLFLYTDATSSWTDVSQTTYSLPATDRWSFTQFGNKLLACNILDNVQSLDIDLGTAATDLGGSPPLARRVATIGDHVWLIGLSSNEKAVMWSGNNNAEWWTLGERDCDMQVFPDGGEVTGVTSLETGLVFQRGAIRRFGVTSDALVYNFGLIDDSRGLIAPDSLVTKGGVAYFLSEEGFCAMSGDGSVQMIGFGQVDEWFQATVDRSNTYSVVGSLDPLRPRIFWTFPTAGTNENLMNCCLCYDITLQEWTYAVFDSFGVLPGATAGLTLDGLDALGYTLDTLPFSLDSRQFAGGAPLLAGFDANRKFGFFTGPNLEARMETGEFQANPQRRTFIRGVTPITDAGSATAQVGARENLQTLRAWGASSPLNAQGFCPTRSSGRYHRVRVSVPAGADWDHAVGVDIDAVQDGQR